jgi:DNA-binding NarL/FixJ family response regulator
MELASVVLIDDDLFTRTTLTAALAGSGINVLSVAENGSIGLEAVKNLNPDVVIADLDLGPGPSGIDICHAIRMTKPSIGLILLTSFTDPRIHDPANSSLPRGCRFVSKSELQDIKVLVQEILIARNKPLQGSQLKKARENLLSDTQIEVLIAVSQGLSTAEIASQRGVTEKAIEGMIAKIHSTLGISRSKSLNQRVQLARSYFKLSGKKPPGA